MQGHMSVALPNQKQVIAVIRTLQEKEYVFQLFLLTKAVIDFHSAEKEHKTWRLRKLLP